jgi:SPIRAL1-like protein
MSSNAFASNNSQNSGNVITDRSTTRVRHAPGGGSSFSFGWTEDEPAPVRQQQEVAPAPFDRQPPTPDRVALLEARLASMGASTAPAPVRAPVFEEAAPRAEPVFVQPAAAAAPVYQEPEPVYEAPAVAVGNPATQDDMKRMTQQELRIVLRERKLNPGGGKADLIERYFDAVKAGACAPMLMNTKSVSSAKVVNNYARPDGQNTGNFMTDRNSSRVLAPPGGRSNFSFGDENMPN